MRTMFKPLHRIADRLQTYWSLWALVGGTGIVTALLARASAWLAPWGPIGWWAAFLIGCLVAAGLFAIFSWAYGRWMRDRELRKIVARSGVNPLADRFDRQTISLFDFYTRDYVPHVNKSFQDCHISGPAMVLMDGCTAERVTFRHCQIVIVNPQTELFGVVVFQRCLISGGVLSNVTILLSREHYDAWPEDMRVGINVISERPNP